MNTNKWLALLSLASFLFISPDFSDNGLVAAERIQTIQTSQSALSAPAEKKFHPGHYISLNRSSASQAVMLDAKKPGVIGIQKRYSWKKLEPSVDKYDFSEIQSDLDFVAKHGMQLVVFVEDKTFKGEYPTPSYLQSDHTLKNIKGGYTAKRWDPYVITRYKALLAKLGQAFDANPALEGVAIQETATSLDDATLDANGYTPEKYRDALITILTAAADSFPKSQVFWYMNFLAGNQSYIEAITSAVAPLGVSMGGPDVLPESKALAKQAYPLYDRFQSRMTLFGSMQNDSYSEMRSGTKTYWTMDEMFRFARDELHVKYIFWNHKNWRKEKSFTWDDALPVIADNPTFNR